MTPGRGPSAARATAFGDDFGVGGGEHLRDGRCGAAPARSAAWWWSVVEHRDEGTAALRPLLSCNRKMTARWTTKLITVAVPCAMTNATGTAQGSSSNTCTDTVVDADLYGVGDRVEHHTAMKRALLGGAWNVQRRLIRYAVVVPAMKLSVLAKFDVQPEATASHVEPEVDDRRQSAGDDEPRSWVFRARLGGGAVSATWEA